MRKTNDAPRNRWPTLLAIAVGKKERGKPTTEKETPKLELRLFFLVIFGFIGAGAPFFFIVCQEWFSSAAAMLSRSTCFHLHLLFSSSTCDLRSTFFGDRNVSADNGGLGWRYVKRGCGMRETTRDDVCYISNNWLPLSGIDISLSAIDRGTVRRFRVTLGYRVSVTEFAFSAQTRSGCCLVFTISKASFGFYKVSWSCYHVSIPSYRVLIT